jgi:hypothetical protein
MVMAQPLADERFARCRRPGGLVASVEPLESRRLLSSSVLGTFAGGVPRVMAPGERVSTAIHLSLATAAEAAAIVKVSLYASPEPQFSPTAVPLIAPAKTVRVKAGHVCTVRWRFSRPSSLEGSYYLLATIDDGQARVDDSLSAVVAPRATRFVPSYVDLTGQIVQQPANEIFVSSTHPGQGKASVLVFNGGNVSAVGSLSITLYASYSPTFDTQSPVVGISVVRKFVSPSGKSEAIAVTFVLPAGTPSGAYHLFALINAAYGIAESNFKNNIASSTAQLIVTNTPPVLVEPHHHRVDGYAVIVIADSGYDDGTVVDETAQPSTDDDSDTTDSQNQTTDGAPTTGPTSAPTTQPADGGADSTTASGPGGDSSGNSGSDAGAPDPGGGDSGADNSF